MIDKINSLYVSSDYDVLSETRWNAGKWRFEKDIMFKIKSNYYDVHEVEVTMHWLQRHWLHWLHYKDIDWMDFLQV